MSESSEIIANNGAEENEGNVESFLLGANTMRDSEEFDDSKSQRSATNLAPFKKDLGNRFSMISPEHRESFISMNPLARSAASTIKVNNEIFEDLDESMDS